MSVEKLSGFRFDFEMKNKEKKRLREKTTFFVTHNVLQESLLFMIAECRLNIRNAVQLKTVFLFLIIFTANITVSDLLVKIRCLL